MYLVETEGDTGRDWTNSELKLIPFYTGYNGPDMSVDVFPDEPHDDEDKGDDYEGFGLKKK